MRIFYSPSISSATSSHQLEKDESHHLTKVLRLKAGDNIEVVDGKGGFFSCKVRLPHQKSTELEILSYQEDKGKRDYKIHVAIAPTKNMDRLEWFLEKATEIGIDEITPLLCHHSERKILKTERIQKIVVSAMKQSGRAYLPKLNELTKFTDFINQSSADLKCIAHCEERKKYPFAQLCSSSSDLLILIGPEGDFSSSEIDQAIHANFQPVSLGESRLRTESAGLVACLTTSIIHENTL